MEKVNMTFTSLHTQRVKSEWIIGPNVRQIFLKEDKIFMTFRYQNFLSQKKKRWTIKEKTDKLNLKH